MFPGVAADHEEQRPGELRRIEVLRSEEQVGIGEPSVLSAVDAGQHARLVGVRVDRDDPRAPTGLRGEEGALDVALAPVPGRRIPERHVAVGDRQFRFCDDEFRQFRPRAVPAGERRIGLQHPIRLANARSCEDLRGRVDEAADADGRHVQVPAERLVGVREAVGVVGQDVVRRGGRRQRRRARVQGSGRHTRGAVLAARRLRQAEGCRVAGLVELRGVLGDRGERQDVVAADDDDRGDAASGSRVEAPGDERVDGGGQPASRRHRAGVGIERRARPAARRGRCRSTARRRRRCSSRRDPCRSGS